MRRRPKFTYMDGSGRRREWWRWLLIPVMLFLLLGLAYDINAQFVAGENIRSLELKVLWRVVFVIILLAGLVRR